MDIEDIFKRFGVKNIGEQKSYNWETVLQKIKEFNEKQNKPVTVGLVHKLFAPDVPYRNMVRQWMERCVNRGLLVRYPPVKPGVIPKRVYYVHIDIYNRLLEESKTKRK